jgi:tRNA 5-methylaminomethyl-2-thiouridine biosynthesis bifunctional protein
MTAKGLAPIALPACGLPTAWGNTQAWAILDTSFGYGANFLDTWQAWRADPHRPKLLHYVAIAPHYCPVAELDSSTPGDTGAQQLDLAQALAAACANLCQGFNRIWLDQSRVSLTLCLGELKLMLGEQAFCANTIFLGSEHWDKWHLKHLCKRSQRGTRFYSAAFDPLAAPLFLEAGFQLDALPTAAPDRPDKAPTPAQTHPCASGVFEPPWRLSTTRQSHTKSAPITTARCAVVGAGIAGATVAHALALRGWQVTVLDAHAGPAGAASGVPAGLVVPQNSADDNPRSRILRRGIHLVLQLMQRYLEPGQDWDLSGVQERKPRPLKGPAGVNAQWHPQAGWVKPAALVRALLDQPRIAFVGQARVAALRWQSGVWLLLDSAGHTLGSAEVVVLANAMACAPLLCRLQAENPATDTATDPAVAANLGLQTTHGTLTRGHYGPGTQDAAFRESLPAFPVNGHGSFLPRVPFDQGFEWMAGATFEAEFPQAHDLAGQHQSNLERLRQLLPDTAAALAPAFAAADVGAWSGTRCTSHDRLPLVGRVLHAQFPQLWMSAAMGSRGLGLAAVCAELLAAELCHEPLPLEASLARCLDMARVTGAEPAPQRNGTPKRQEH